MTRDADTGRRARAASAPGPVSSRESIERRETSLLSRRALLALPLVLIACGFSPALAPPNGTLSGITLADPGDRLGFVYRRAMQDLIAEPGPRRLTYGITLSEEAVLITTAQETQRVQATGTVTWALAEANGVQVANGAETAFTSWSGSGTVVSLRASQRDAHDRLMRILAERTVARLIAVSP